MRGEGGGAQGAAALPVRIKFPWCMVKPKSLYRHKNRDGHMCIYIYIYMCMYMYICIYTERETDRDRKRDRIFIM